MCPASAARSVPICRAHLHIHPRTRPFPSQSACLADQPVRSVPLCRPVQPPHPHTHPFPSRSVGPTAHPTREPVRFRPEQQTAPTYHTAIRPPIVQSPLWHVSIPVIPAPQQRRRFPRPTRPTRPTRTPHLAHPPPQPHLQPRTQPHPHPRIQQPLLPLPSRTQPPTLPQPQPERPPTSTHRARRSLTAAVRSSVGLS